MTQCEHMMEMLREAGSHGVTSREFVEWAQVFKYTNRISDLRAAGHVIDAERVKGSLYRYILRVDATRVSSGELGLVGRGT